MGQTVSREDLDAGVLQGQFADEDYALEDSVSHSLSYLCLVNRPFCLLTVILPIPTFCNTTSSFPSKPGGQCAPDHVTSNYRPP